ncbi:ABC transporter permease [Dyadobacter sp. CY261]|uniref:ABC transporter permease n=1 Tax=Dyadobacter sp. CY261 TaxID=2907203 RepID=UPI001F33027A|nr:ABC transporter permease [Dyadobacter sp. CY261]MCF0068894.1 ABC transporter permease [Dyadobacter sp. CY261]
MKEPIQPPNKQNPLPPRWPGRFLRLFCAPHLVEELEGDLQELFAQRLRMHGEQAARTRYLRDVFGMVRPFAFKREVSKYPQPSAFQSAMIRNYFKIALRNMWKNKGFSALNITGLVTGITACLMILQYVSFELSFDRFHHDFDRIYRITNDRFQQGKLIQHGTITYPAVAPTMAKDFNEIETYTTLANPGTFSLQKDRRIFEEKGAYTDERFLSVFTFPLLAGDRATALKAPHSIIISETNAKRIFNAGPDQYANLIGKTVKVDVDTEPYQITGIMKDFPATSHLQFGALMSFETLALTWGEWIKNSWESSDVWHYAKLRPGTDAASLEKKLPAFSQRHFRGDKVSGSVEQFFLQPLSKAHLFSDYEYEIGNVNNGKAVWTMLIIAAFILLIAWINYINLATARSLERAREVGVRKVAGATSGQLIGQFLSESVVLNALALVLGIVLALIFQPVLNKAIDKPLSFALLTGAGFGGPKLALMLSGVFVSGILLSGFYPAFALSSFKAVQVLKGSFKRSAKGAWVRQSLVIFQYTASMVLIVGTFIVFKQLKFMREEKLGFNMDQVLVIRGPQLTLWDSTSIDRINSFKTELERIPSVQIASASGSLFGNRLSRSFNIRRVGANQEKGVTFSRMPVDADFFETYKIPVVAGRNFLPTDSNPDSRKVTTAILNESAIKLLGFANAGEAAGQKFVVNGKEWEIVGVVSDFHQQSLKSNIEPIVFAPFYTLAGFFSIKINTADPANTIAGIREKYNAFFPGNNFDYFFMDQRFNEQYKDDQTFGKVSSFFSFLAVLIASLGIFGLSSYTISQRTKEIGVRKVLGATTSGIVALLSKDFLKLVLFAIGIGAPIAWYGVNQWLSDFAYRIDIEWWMFAIAAAVSLLIAFASVSFQSVRAALMSPVKSLRSE